jgi:hypothetical protein
VLLGLLGALNFMSCTRADTPGESDSTKPVRPARLADSIRTVSLPDQIRQAVVTDTTTAAHQQRNLMSAPIHEWPLSAKDADTLRWIAQSDSCAFVIVSRMAATQPGFTSDNAVMVGEWFGYWEIGPVFDVAPSPDWTWMAYSKAEQLTDGASSWQDLAHDTKLSVNELRSLADSGPFHTLVLPIPVITPLLDTCSGDDCSLDAASPALGGKRVGWTSDGRLALLSGRRTTDWVAVDPETRAQRKGSPQKPYVLNWTNRPVASAMLTPPRVISGGGPYTFFVRGDSIVVRGPDFAGHVAERVVGSGVPLAVTRNGEYVLAVRREGQRLATVLYVFTLFHAMISSSCDR